METLQLNKRTFHLFMWIFVKYISSVCIDCTIDRISRFSRCVIGVAFCRASSICFFFASPFCLASNYKWEFLSRDMLSIGDKSIAIYFEQIFLEIDEHVLLIYLLFDIVFASFKLPFVFDRIKDTFCQYLCTNLGTNGFNAASFVTICFCEMRKIECQQNSWNF